MAGLIEQETLRGDVGEYRIYESIASGGFGSVFIGRDTATNVPVAVKRLHPHLRDQAGFAEGFEREATTVRGLIHPSVVRLLDQGRDQHGVPFIVMEWVEGQTVSNWMNRRGRYVPAEAAEVVCQVLEGLEAAWSRKIVHRDIKPANLMVTPSGQVKIMDFGVAKDVELATMAGASGVIGTPAYMCPEQLNGQPLDCRADLYALGVTLYQMLAGRPPFQGPTMTDYFRQHLTEQPPALDSMVPGLDPGMAAIVYRALAKKPEERWSTPSEMLAALRPYANELATVRNLPPVPYHPGAQHTPTARRTPVSYPSVAPAGATEAVGRRSPSVSSASSSSIPLPGGLAGLPPAALAVAGGTVVAVIALVVVLLVVRPGSSTQSPSTLPTPTLSGPAPTPAVSGGVFRKDDLNNVAVGIMPKASPKPADYFVGYGADYTIQTLNRTLGLATVVVPGTYDDAALAIDARVVDASANPNITLSCRDQPTGGSGYRLVVNPGNGQVSLSRFAGGSPSGVAEAPNTDALTRGAEFNHLELICAGPNITAKINGTQVAGIQDSSYRDGVLHIGAGAAQGQTVEAHFKGLVVTRP